MSMYFCCVFEVDTNGQSMQKTVFYVLQNKLICVTLCYGPSKGGRLVIVLSTQNDLRLIIGWLFWCIECTFAHNPGCTHTFLCHTNIMMHTPRHMDMHWTTTQSNRCTCMWSPTHISLSIYLQIQWTDVSSRLHFKLF
jgi:hypothetical protein